MQNYYALGRRKLRLLTEEPQKYHSHSMVLGGLELMS